jgi:proteasome accessory factor A
VDERTFALRNEYSVAFSADRNRQLSPEEVTRRLLGPVVSGGPGRAVLLRNGGRLYIDAVSRPGYATPECGSVPDLVVHDKAGERILEGLLEEARQRLHADGIAGDIHVFKASTFKASTGPAASSAGCQEDYLVGRAGNFGRLADILVPFLVTRQLICGAGALVLTPRGVRYCLSRWAGSIGDGQASPVVQSRPFIGTRDEPYTAAAGLRRLHVFVSEPTMSETTTLLKAGTTDLLLRMAEAGTVLPDLTLDKPVQAIGMVSRDVTGRSRVRLASGREMSALDIQREYLASAKNFTDRHGADVAGRRVLDLWERALDALGTGNLAAIAREIDWVIKYRLIEQYRAAHDLPLSAPQVAQADLAYHDIHRAHGLYYDLQRRNKVGRTARDISIFEAKTVPPVSGRYRQAG